MQNGYYADDASRTASETGTEVGHHHGLADPHADHSPAGPSGSQSGSDEPDGYHGREGRQEGALSILMKLAEALDEDGTERDLPMYEDDGESHLLGKPGKEANYDDILDSTWSADVPKRRVGGIRRAKVIDDDDMDESEEDENPVYCAQPFNQPDIEAVAEDPTLAAHTQMEPNGDPATEPWIYPLRKHAAMGSGKPYKAFQRRRKVNWYGASVFFLYIVALILYLFIRITKTLDLGGYVAYGAYVLIVEILGAISTLLYGVNLLWDPINEQPEADPTNPSLPLVSLPYHIRVLIPCYREPLQIVVKTIQAAYDAALPNGCHRTVYVCDDGKDPRLRRFCRAMGPSVVYVSGRRREAGEMNGKSGNLNNCLSQVYPEGVPVPPNELTCIFDADQVANSDFYLKMLPLFDGGLDVGMVLSPQCFHNLRLHADVFNHANIHFWEYAQHGYDALGFISCTGTNFLIRSMAFQEANWSPTFTLTEDFALGMYLKMNRWHCRYVEEYLAIGEAPDQVRNCFQQRSRWCKGHFQVVFSRAHCPLLQRKLGWFDRILYCSGVFSYVVGAITTPTFILIPILTVWVGVFPIVISQWAALGLTVYTIVQTMVLSHCKRLSHVEALWFSGVANSILWWTFAKACFNALLSKLGKRMTFKATLKGLGGRLAASAFIDLWMPILCFVLLAVSLGIGIGKVASGPSVVTTLTISVCWMVYNMVAPFLLIHYAFIGRGATLAFWARVGFLLSYLAAISALLLLWFVYPRDYDYGTATGNSLYFLDAMKVGQLPADNPVPWRANSLLYEASPTYGFKDLTGGYYQGGAVGYLKMTQPLAFSTALLAWGMHAFKAGFSSGAASNTASALENVMWGADYLNKCWRAGNANGTSTAGYTLVYQVGNLTLDSAYYGAPETFTASNMPRPAYVVETARGASDLAGSMAAALAASAMAVKAYGTPAQQPSAASYLTAAETLYAAGKATLGGYTAQVGTYSCVSQYAKQRIGATGGNSCPAPTSFAGGSALVYYNSTSYYDDMFWAASWLYLATDNAAYMNDITGTWYGRQGDVDATAYVTNYNTVYWAANVLLATTNVTNVEAFHAPAQTMLQTWVCGETNGGSVVSFTPKGRAWNPVAPDMGTTTNAALLAAVYGQVKSAYITAQQSARYICFARSQSRWVLGDTGESLMVGFGSKYPTHVQNEAASCKSPSECTQANSFNVTSGNPHVITGAVPEFTTFSDHYQDVRASNNSRVTMAVNAAFPSTMAGLNQAPGSWDSCLQGYGVLTGTGGVCAAGAVVGNS